MIEIENLDHVGIRVSDKDASLSFYQALGFELAHDAGFDRGHPMVLRHAASGDVLNLLGPATASAQNILMDVPEKHAGITHVSYRVKSIEATGRALAAIGVPISGELNAGSFHAIFIRDPDRNVVEFDGQ